MERRFAHAGASRKRRTRKAYNCQYCGARQVVVLRAVGNAVGAAVRIVAWPAAGAKDCSGINFENLMSQTGRSPTSQELERSQLEQIFSTSDFR